MNSTVHPECSTFSRLEPLHSSFFFLPDVDVIFFSADFNFQWALMRSILTMVFLVSFLSTRDYLNLNWLRHIYRLVIAHLRQHVNVMWSVVTPKVGSKIYSTTANNIHTMCIGRLHQLLFVCHINNGLIYFPIFLLFVLRSSYHFTILLILPSEHKQAIVYVWNKADYIVAWM